MNKIPLCFFCASIIENIGGDICASRPTDRSTFKRDLFKQSEFILIHPNHDSEKFTYPRHISLVSHLQIIPNRFTPAVLGFDEDAVGEAVIERQRRQAPGEILIFLIVEAIRLRQGLKRLAQAALNFRLGAGDVEAKR